MDTQSLRRLLLETKTIAIVGLSAKWHRPSNFVGKYLIHHGYEVIPVNPNYDEILGKKCYPDLASIPTPVDVVDIFQRAESAPGYAQQAKEIGAKSLWLQLGIESEAAEQVAMKADMQFVQDKCMKIEHARIFGGLNFIGVNTKIISSARNKVIAN